MFLYSKINTKLEQIYNLLTKHHHNDENTFYCYKSGYYTINDKAIEELASRFKKDGFGLKITRIEEIHREEIDNIVNSLQYEMMSRFRDRYKYWLFNE